MVHWGPISNQHHRSTNQSGNQPTHQSWNNFQPYKSALSPSNATFKCCLFVTASDFKSVTYKYFILHCIISTWLRQLQISSSRQQISCRFWSFYPDWQSVKMLLCCSWDMCPQYSGWTRHIEHSSADNLWSLWNDCSISALCSTFAHTKNGICSYVSDKPWEGIELHLAHLTSPFKVVVKQVWRICD